MARSVLQTCESCAAALMTIVPDVAYQVVAWNLLLTAIRAGPTVLQARG
jgi:hypothetical protein